MKQILIFGDSNTRGLIPGTQDRYPWGVRWTSILHERCQQTQIIEEGLCGRTTVFEDTLRPGRKGIDILPILLETHMPLDAAIVMLGTNDCKTCYHATAPEIGKGIELCLLEIEKHLPSEKILLISPILLGDAVWKPEKDPEFDRGSVAVCKELKGIYREVAAAHGCSFLAAQDYALVSEVDEEHLTPKGHAALAEAVYGKLTQMNVI